MGIRLVAMGAMVLLALLLKTTVTPAMAIAGARPDVLVLVVVGVALLEGPDTGLRLGFLAGLTQDLIAGGNTLVGLGALVMMGVGYAAGRVKPYLASSQQAGAVAFAGLSAAGATLAYGLLGRLFDVVGAPIRQVIGLTIVGGIYTAAVSPVVLRVTQGVMKQFPAVSG